MQNEDSRSGKAKLLPLPIGNSDWAEVRSEYWSADKTQLIAELLDRKTSVALFTRPRRFGKTTAMEMIKSFFEKTGAGNAQMFEGTKVWQNPEYREEQGKYPVIFVTFKDAKGGDWNDVCRNIAASMRAEFKRHRSSFEDPSCDKDAVSLFDDILDR